MPAQFQHSRTNLYGLKLKK